MDTWKSVELLKLLIQHELAGVRMEVQIDEKHISCVIENDWQAVVLKKTVITGLSELEVRGVYFEARARVFVYNNM